MRTRAPGTVVPVTSTSCEQMRPEPVASVGACDGAVVATMKLFETALASD